jgi:predicted dehydrogenase
MTPFTNRRTFLTGSMASLTTALMADVVPNSGAKTSLRLGIISAASYGATYADANAVRTPGSHHGTAFSTTFNGWDEEKLQPWQGTFVKSSRRLEGARVVKIWDPNQNAARLLADICSIDTVVDSPEACCEGVDAILIVDDGSGSHWKYAQHALRKGVATFCDKPLAMTSKEALAVVKLVRETKTPFMSASSLRFVPDIVKLREELPQMGNVHLASVACGNDLVYYGIHALSMAYAVLGKGFTSAINVGKPGANLVRLRFGDRGDVMLIVADKEVMRGGFQINLYGGKAWRSVTPDLKDLYSYLLEAFLEQLNTGKEAVPVEEEAELIAALEASRRSLELGREVTLEEVLFGS